ncbi:tautomerase family protein [Actinomadura sp. DSM 109109]|nr:tautomerase family protein [Actinomadura lepetitiana]
MPLVRIDALRMDPARLEALGDAVQQALMDSIGFPAEDRFQILTTHDGVTGTLRHGTYLDVPRDDGIVYIDITMRAGRTDDQKKNLYSRVCALAEERAGVAPHNVFIVIHENTPADWSLGHGQAHYLP